MQFARQVQILPRPGGFQAAFLPKSARAGWTPDRNTLGYAVKGPSSPILALAKGEAVTMVLDWVTELRRLTGRP